MRQAFSTVWFLNFKAMPTALLWAISIWLLLQSPSILIKAIALITAYLSAVISAYLILKLDSPSANIKLIDAMKNRFVLKKTLLIGVLLVISFANLRQFEDALPVLQIVYVSISFSLLLMWALITIFLIPLSIQLQMRKIDISNMTVLTIFLSLKKRSVLISLVIIFFTWPLIFFYIFVALTLTQSIIFSQLSSQIDQNTLSNETGAHHD